MKIWLEVQLPPPPQAEGGRVHTMFELFILICYWRLCGWSLSGQGIHLCFHFLASHVKE